MNLSRFEQFWLAEHQRLHDVGDPQLQQDQYKLSELPQAAAQDQLLHRAASLSQRQGLLQALHHWQLLRRLLTASFALVALLIGIGTSQAMLSQTQPISLLFALNLLLLPNLLLFLFWFMFALRRSRPSGISGAAITLLHILQRKRGGERLEQSWLSYTRQHGLLQPLMAVATHGFWLCIMLSSWLTLIVYLTFDDYQFQWATTILAVEQMLAIADVINWLPQLVFGAHVPAINEGSGAIVNANEAGRWLTLCVLTYGVAPRAIAVVIACCLYIVRLQHMKLNLQAEGHAGVLQAYTTTQQRGQDIDPDQGDADEQWVFTYAQQGEGSYTLSLDYEADPKLRVTDTYLGVVASYAEKQQLLQQRRAEPSERLHVRVATQLTPDRSSLRFLAQLACTTKQLTVILVRGANGTYLPQWQQQLERYGVDYVIA